MLPIVDDDAADQGQLSYSVTGVGGAHFAVDHLGRMTLVGAGDAQPLNYEETARYNLMVTVSDPQALSVTFGIRVDIEDVNDAPRFEGEEDPYLIAVREDSVWWISDSGVADSR